MSKLHGTIISNTNNLIMGIINNYECKINMEKNVLITRVQSNAGMRMAKEKINYLGLFGFK